MYRGKNAVVIAQQSIGESISFTHISGYTPDYDTDEDIPTEVTTIINCQVEDLSKKDRELLEGQYDLDKMIKIHLPKDSIIDIEDSFSRDGNNYTIVQSQKNLNNRVVYCNYDQRI